MNMDERGGVKCQSRLPIAEYRDGATGTEQPQGNRIAGYPAHVRPAIQGRGAEPKPLVARGNCFLFTSPHAPFYASSVTGVTTTGRPYDRHDRLQVKILTLAPIWGKSGMTHDGRTAGLWAYSHFALCIRAARTSPTMKGQSGAYPARPRAGATPASVRFPRPACRDSVKTEMQEV